MKMMDKFLQVEILKAMKMIVTMVDTFSQVGNLKTTMLVMMTFLQVSILKVLMKSFLQVRISKAQMRMKKNSPQVGILKEMMMIMAKLDSLSTAEFKISNVSADDFPPSEDFQGTDEDNEDFPPSEDFQASNEDDEEYLSSGNFQSSENDYTIGGHSFPSDKLKNNNVDVDFLPSEDFQDTDEDFQGTKQDGENFHLSGDFESMKMIMSMLDTMLMVFSSK